MGEEKRSPSEVLRCMLDELGIEHDKLDRDANHYTYWDVGGVRYKYTSYGDPRCGCLSICCANFLTPEQAIAATVGDEKGSDGRVSMARQMRTVLESRRTCASCPEMDNPDSYIRHLQSALKWHDEHVPRPTNPNATCVVLQGERPPEEMLFVREDGGVTHYLPEDTETCRIEEDYYLTDPHDLGRLVFKRMELSCGHSASYLVAEPPTRCPRCGAKMVSE